MNTPVHAVRHMAAIESTRDAGTSLVETAFSQQAGSTLRGSPTPRLERRTSSGFDLNLERSMLRKRSATLLSRRWSSTSAAPAGRLTSWSTEVQNWISMEKGGQVHERPSGVCPSHAPHCCSPGRPNQAPNARVLVRRRSGRCAICPRAIRTLTTESEAPRRARNRSMSRFPTPSISCS